MSEKGFDKILSRHNQFLKNSQTKCYKNKFKYSLKVLKGSTLYSKEYTF